MSASGEDLVREIGKAVMDDELLRDAVRAYSSAVDCGIPVCVAWLLKHALTMPAFGYLQTRETVEFVASPKLTAALAGPAAPTPATTPTKTTEPNVVTFQKPKRRGGKP